MRAVTWLRRQTSNRKSPSFNMWQFKKTTNKKPIRYHADKQAKCKKAKLWSLYPLPLSFAPIYPQFELPLPHGLVWSSKATPFPIREFQDLEMTEAPQPSPPTSAWTFLLRLPRGCSCFSRPPPTVLGVPGPRGASAPLWYCAH